MRRSVNPIAMVPGFLWRSALKLLLLRHGFSFAIFALAVRRWEHV